jgi:hypothetical protein
MTRLAKKVGGEFNFSDSPGVIGATSIITTRLDVISFFWLNASSSFLPCLFSLICFNNPTLSSDHVQTKLYNHLCKFVENIPKVVVGGSSDATLRLNANARFVSPALYNQCIHRVATETGAIRNTKQLPTVSVRYFLVVILRQIARTSTRFVSVSRPTWVVPKSMCGLAVKETCFESMLPIV